MKFVKNVKMRNFNGLIYVTVSKIFNMKYLFFVLMIMPFILNGQNKVKYDNLEQRDGLFYEMGKLEPYSGQCYSTFPNGQLGLGGNIKEGLRDGEWVWYYENGTQRRFATYKNGLKHGPTIFFYNNGIKKSEIIFDNDKNIRQSSWDEKGNRISNPSFNQFK